MENNSIHSCHLGPGISPETFIHEHFFLFLINGSMNAYDGHKHHQLVSGEACIARKNHLIRYTKTKVDSSFTKVVIVLDEPLLRRFQLQHVITPGAVKATDAFVRLPENSLLISYIDSLRPYYQEGEQIDAAFADVKREELLLILLRIDPSLAPLLFDFSVPQKIELEAFMNQNFRFNVSLERFAFLTGRSLSAFKRDFIKIFRETPGRWLTRKRLDEAYFLITKQQQKAADVYLDVGFEDLSHFSFAFKKRFGVPPRSGGIR